MNCYLEINLRNLLDLTVVHIFLFPKNEFYLEIKRYTKKLWVSWMVEMILFFVTILKEFQDLPTVFLLNFFGMLFLEKNQKLQFSHFQGRAEML